MLALRDGEADLVLTSPPYFSGDLELLLRRPVAEQSNAEGLRIRLLSDVECFRPQYIDICRVLALHGTLILQLKDLVYGGQVVRIADRHASLVEELGLRLTARFWWRCQFQHPKRQSRTLGQVYKEPEQFLIFQRSGLEGIAVHGDRARVPEQFASSPFWVSPGEGGRRRMAHQAPQSVVRPLIEMFSDPGDLMLDPFAGSGESLLTASKMGRRAIGYEIQEVRVEEFGRVAARRRG